MHLAASSVPVHPDVHLRSFGSFRLRFVFVSYLIFSGPEVHILSSPVLRFFSSSFHLRFVSSSFHLRSFGSFRLRFVFVSSSFRLSFVFVSSPFQFCSVQFISISVQFSSVHFASSSFHLSSVMFFY
jgi:hypothetical protein